ncbi:MAG: hypothetical protein U0R44_01720 [Candidatus Micrarchaeia archaeon]
MKRQPDFSFSIEEPVTKKPYGAFAKAAAFARGLLRQGPLVEVALGSFGLDVAPRDAVAYENRLERLDDRRLLDALRRELGQEARDTLERVIVSRYFRPVRPGMVEPWVLRGIPENENLAGDGWILFPKAMVSRLTEMQRVRGLLMEIQDGGRAGQGIRAALLSITCFGPVAEKAWRAHYYDESYGQGLYEAIAGENKNFRSR